MLQKTIKEIEEVILTKQYPFFRLTTKMGESIVPVKNLRKNDTIGYMKHWQFVKHKLVNELPIGEYVLECYYDVARKHKYNYTIVKTEEDNIQAVVLQPEEKFLNGKIEKNKTQPIMTEKEYIEMIKENAELKARESVLVAEVAYLKNKVGALESENNELIAELEDFELSDDSPAEQGGLMGGISAILPILAPLADKYFEQKERELNILEKKSNQKFPVKSLSPANVPTENNQQSLNDSNKDSEYQDLLNQIFQIMESDPEAADNELDIIQSSDIETYNRLMSDLGMEENNDNQFKQA